MANRNSRRNSDRKWKIEKGDVLKKLRNMEDNVFDAGFTDAPYGLGFMGHRWDKALPSVEVWQEVLRVCKPGAPLLSFGSPRTSHRLACYIEDAGWEIRDGLMWLHGEGFPKSHDISKAIDKKLGGKRKVVGKKRTPHRGVKANHRYGFSSPKKPIELTAAATRQAKQWEGFGTGLKPGWEPIVLAMKPRDGSFADNALTWGCGGLNIDGCRVGTNGGTKRSHQAEYPRKANGKEDRTTWGRTGHSVEPVDKGRWPANVILDPEAGEMLDRQSGVSKSRRSKRRNFASNVGNGKTLNPFKSRVEGSCGYGDEGGASRFFYCAKASRQEKRGNDHATVKPLKLCQYLGTLILPPKGRKIRRLLVPYSGTGSEMIGALLAGWDYVLGIEIDPEYVKTARRRLARRMP